MFKKILSVFAAIVIVAAIIPVFVNGEYTVKRSIEINAPQQQVFDYLKYLRNHDEFSVWSKIDPNMKKSFRNTDGELGFVSRWESNHPDVGTGEQEIVKLETPKHIEHELRFIEPFSSVSPMYLDITKKDSALTEVTWTFEGDMGYPFSVLLLTMDMDEVIGKDLDGGLKNLKQIMEKTEND